MQKLQIGVSNAVDELHLQLEKYLCLWSTSETQLSLHDWGKKCF